MSDLSPGKLHTTFTPPTSPVDPMHPRCYVLTHSDRTGDLFLIIGPEFDQQQFSGWYARLMRDEVLAVWTHEHGGASLHVHCHVSGGLVLGSAAWRMRILRQHMPQVIEAFRYGDRAFIEAHPELDAARIYVHFHSHKDPYNLIEEYGSFMDYKQEG
jgi:hypothetical protein